MHFAPNQYYGAMLGYSGVNQRNNWIPSDQIQLPPEQYNSYQYATSTGEISVGFPLASPAYSDISDASPQPRRRNRTVFTSRQLKELHAEFQSDHYLPNHRRVELAERLNLTEKQIKVWFQNKRMKEKKETREREDRVASSIENLSPCFLAPLAPVESAPQYNADEGLNAESFVLPGNYCFSYEDCKLLEHIALNFAQTENIIS